MEKENVESRAITIAEGKTGIDPSKEIAKLDGTLTPLEEARTLTENMTQMKKDMIQLLGEIQRASGDMALAGRSFAGNRPVEKTKDDIDKEDADKYLRMFK
jgi:hypothetical protein